MVAKLENAELQQFLERAVRDGRFASVDAAIEVAVFRLKEDEENLLPLDDELEARLVEAEAQVARGEFYTIEQVRATFAAKVGSRG